MLSYILRIICFSVIFFFDVGCESLSHVNYSQKVKFPSRGIFPLKFDSSNENKIFFSYTNNGATAIFSMDMLNGNLLQLTDDSLSCFQPVVSHDGKTILCKCGQVLGGVRNYFLLNSDGSDSHLLLNTDYKMYISDAVFSQDDKTIYFIGGSEFSDSSDVTKYNEHCQDVFSIDINGSKLRRITRECFSNSISDLAILNDTNRLLISVNGEELFITGSKQREDFYWQRKRKPLALSGLYELTISDGSLKEFQINDSQKFKALFNNQWGTATFKGSNDNKYLIAGDGDYYKLDIDNKLFMPFIDSVNGFKYGAVDSLEFYNLVCIQNENKILAGSGPSDDYKFILFDVEKKRIVSEYLIDSNKFIPSLHRRLMRE